MTEAGGEAGQSHWSRLRKATDDFVGRIFGAPDKPGTPQMLLALGLALTFYLPSLAWIPISWLLKKLWRIRRLIGSGILVAACCAVGLLLGWWLTNEVFTDDPCQQSDELRVVTTPDAQLVLQAQAASFMAEQQRNGCDVTVSVSSVDSFGELSRGFASAEGAWRPAVQQIPLIPGPHPDIVIPALSAQADQLQAIESDDFALDNEGSLATSKVVLAVPFAYELGQGDLPTLLAEAGDSRLRVARPDPERSEAALVFTRSLYQLDAEQPLPTAERQQQEADLSPADVPLDNAAASFCRRGSRDVGIVLPEHVFHSFDTKAIPSSLCVGSELTPVSYKQVPITGLPALDYPFVRVRWPGQSDRERDRLISAFRDWLRQRLPSAGFDAAAKPGSGLSVAQYQETVAAHRQARREVQVLFLLDNSGSMRKHVADGRSLDRGGRLVSRITDRLGGADWAALWALPGEDREGAAQRVAGGPVTIEQSRRLKNAVDELELTTGNYSPVYAGLVHALRQMEHPEQLTVILVTDGENRVPAQQPVEDLAFEAAVRELTATGARLEVLAVSPSECAFEDLAQLDRRPDLDLPTRCVPAAYGDIDTLVSQVVGRLRAEG